MTRRTQIKKKVRTQHTQSFKDEALDLAEKVGVARAAVDLGLHDSQPYDWRQKASLRSARGWPVQFHWSTHLTWLPTTVKGQFF